MFNMSLTYEDLKELKNKVLTRQNLLIASAGAVTLTLTSFGLLYRAIRNHKKAAKPNNYRKVNLSKIKPLPNRKNKVKDRFIPANIDKQIPKNIDFIVIGSGNIYKINKIKISF